MEYCKENDIIACGLFLIAEDEKKEERKKEKNENTDTSMTNVALFHTDHLHLRLLCF
jgi:hypothetical protein